MIVSWNWLKEYVDLDISEEELSLRLAMSGLNHESTESVGQDLAIDLEVTSNRPDCLGHIGIAREVAVLCDVPLRIPSANPKAIGPDVSQAVTVTIDCPDLCSRYTARLIRGVRVGPSPQWLKDRLATIGQPSVNNIVDISNYVMMECGQPLHTFDFAKIQGNQIRVRNAAAKESFQAIDHRTYELQPNICVIADENNAVAIAGVMGGAATEVADSTSDVLIEAADFDPLATRATARALKLFSASSYRFERTVDPEGIDWASRRCAELILACAGGTLCDGVVDTIARPEPPVPTVTLRWSQLERVLGIHVAPTTVRRILHQLGNQEQSADDEKIVVRPPSWRRDLHREIDLIEEVARIDGYEKIPENVSVTMVAAQKTKLDRVISVLRNAMTAVGLDEAMTTSVVPKSWSDAMSFWSEEPALETATPMLRGASCLRRSLIPSLLNAKRANEAQQNDDVALFEIARIYLPKHNSLPQEPWTLGIVCDADLLTVKGAIEAMVHRLKRNATLLTEECQLPACGGDGCRLTVNGVTVGVLGQLDAAGRKQFEQRRPASFAELLIEPLQAMAELVPQYATLSTYPAIRRDLNLIVGADVRWSSLAETISAACGPLLDGIQYRETFRDEKRDGTNKKRLMFSFQLRADDRTLTREEADEISRQVVSACARQYDASLVG